MEYNYLEDSFEFLSDLDELHRLVEHIAWKLRAADTSVVLDAFFDIRTFGDEPVFTSILHDMMIKEENARRQKSSTQEFD